MSVVDLTIDVPVVTLAVPLSDPLLEVSGLGISYPLGCASCRELSSIAYLKFTKLNSDPKGEEGVTSVAPLELCKATGFNVQGNHAHLRPWQPSSEAHVLKMYPVWVHMASRSAF